MEKKKILILEDEKSLARALQLKLSRADFKVSVAYNGEEGLSATESEEFDFIICDLIMPKMDGFTFLREIREKGISTPVLVLTNLSQKEDQEKVSRFTSVTFFIKSDTPINKIVEHVTSELKD